MKILIYTALYGQLKYLSTAPKINDVDTILVTDIQPLDSKGWDVRILPIKDLSNQRAARRVKILPHEYFPDYDLTLWVDCNVDISYTITEFISKYKKYNITIYNHNTTELDNRDCVYDEAEAVKKLHKEHPKLVDDQMNAYFNDGYPTHNGLISSGVILRHNNNIVNTLMTEWWKELEKHTARDQLSFNYVAWKTNTEFHCINDDIRNNKYFTIKTRNLHIPMIHTYIPYAPQLHHTNLGWTYNNFMELIGEQDWACFLDHDATFTTRDWYPQLETIISRNEKTYGVFTCMTNRIHCKFQKATGVDQNNHDIRYHRKIGRNAQDLFRYDVKELNQHNSFGDLLSGVLILISKKTWRAVGGFADGFLGVDNKIHKDCLDNNIKVGLMQGVYVYHWYRGDGDKKHLDIANKLNKNPMY